MRSDCPWERGRPARILFLMVVASLMVVAELPRGFAGSHYAGSNRNGLAEKSQGAVGLIQVEGMTEAVPVIVRAGRPRSQEAFDHTINREHGLHPAQELGKEPCAGLKNHSPLEGGVGERAEPAVEPEGGKRRAP